MSFTPKMIARHDQDMAALGKKLDGLIAGIREQVDKFGEPQAAANTALLIADYNSPGMNGALLLAALMRLAREEGP